MKLYSYCVADDREARSIDIDGIDGSSVETLVEGDLIAAVSAFAGDRVAVTRANVLQHEKVVRTLLEKTTPLPFRFGTLVTSQQLRSYLVSRSDSLKLKLAEVRGCVEMNIKIIWVPSDASTTSEVQPTDGEGESDKYQGRGARFLLNKRDQLLGKRRAIDSAEQVRNWIETIARPLVKTQLINVEPESKMFFSGAYLVERDRLESFRQVVKGARETRPELKFLLSGPWAPYSFSNIDLEFQSQFGVS